MDPSDAPARPHHVFDSRAFFGRPCWSRALELLTRCAHHYAGPFTVGPEIAEDDVLTMHMPEVISVSGEFSELTIYRTPTDNYAFRAWHDRRHIALRAGFDRNGEARVARQQRYDLISFATGSTREKSVVGALALLEVETEGQQEYQRRRGHFPHNQRAFTAFVLKYGLAAALDIEF